MASAPLFGRAEERAWLMSRLGPGLVTLHGPPGIGKTHLCRHTLGGSPLWLDARALKALGVEPSEALARALDLPVLANEELLRALLRERHRIIIWDNAEWLPNLPETLRAWLEDGAQATFLVLTRTRTEPGPNTLALGELEDPGAAQALFLHHAHEDPGLDAHVASLVELLERHPLSLTLAAAQTRWLTASDLERRLAARAPGVRIEALGATARVQDLVQSSWDRLGDAAQTLLLRAASLSLSLPLRDLWDLTPPDPEALSELVTSSLATVTEARALDISSLVRAFCGPLRQERADELHDWMTRAARNLLQEHAQGLDRLRKLDDSERVTLICDRHDLFTLLATHPGLERRERVTLATLGWESGRVLESSAQSYRQGRALLNELDKDLAARPWEATRLDIALTIEDLTRSLEETHMRRLERLRELAWPEPALEGSWWKLEEQLLLAHMMRGEPEEAAARIEELHARRDELRVSGRGLAAHHEALFEMRVGSWHYQMDRLEQAMGHYRTALSLARDAGDQHTEALTLHNMAIIYTDESRLAEARSCLETSQRLEQFTGRTLRSLNGLSLGLVHLRSGLVDEAERVTRDALELMSRSTLRGYTPMAWSNLAAINLERQDFDAAQRCIDQSIEGARAVPADPSLWVGAHLMLASIRLEQGRHEDALAIVTEEVAPHLEHVTTPSIHVMFHGTRALTLARNADIEGAKASLHAMHWDSAEGHHGAIEAHIRSFVLWQEHLLRLREGTTRERRASFKAWLEYERTIDRGFVPRSEAVRHVRRILERSLTSPAVDLWRALDARYQERNPEVLTRSPWIVTRDGHWVLPPQGPWIDLGGHEQLARLLVAIGRGEEGPRTEPVDLDALQRIVWPEEFIEHEAARNRLHVSLSKLRKRGLGPLLGRRGDGYVFPPEQHVRWV